MISELMYYCQYYDIRVDACCQYYDIRVDACCQYYDMIIRKPSNENV